MWQLKKEQSVPIYRSIMEMIVQKIQTGELLPGEKIPSERKLAEYLSVNRSTVVHALDELVDLGWIVRKRGAERLSTKENGGNDDATNGLASLFRTKCVQTSSSLGGRD